MTHSAKVPFSGRARRARPPRLRQAVLGAHRRVVRRSNSHMYAQVIAPDAKVVAAASTLDKAVAQGAKSGSTVAAASAVGKFIAERALQKGVEKVAFDRSGYRYHGRVRAVAEAAREGGLKF